MSKKCPICGWKVFPKKPGVTEEFVRKWADIIRRADTSLFGIKGELELVRQMLREAGVEVKDE